MRTFKFTGLGTYIPIDTFSLAAQTLTTVATVYTLTGGKGLATPFYVGDKLYIDGWLNITTPNANAAATVTVTQSTSATQGQVNCVELDTQGFSPLPMGVNNTSFSRRDSRVRGSQQPYGSN